MPLEALLHELEQNLSESLSVEHLAEAGLFSRSQLYREFYSATGHSVKEYVRKRRLSRALALIRHTDTPLEQVAGECGFGSQQALCKSVKAAVGLTPTQYKAGGGECFFPPCDGKTWPQPVTVSPETIPPTLRLRYYDSRLAGIEDRALAWLFAERPGFNGRVFGRNGKQLGSKLCYELYIEASPIPPSLHPNESADSPGTPAPAKGADSDFQPAFSGTFAGIACPNIEEEINAAWDYLYNTWLKTSMFAAATGQQWIDMPFFEEYIHMNGQVRRLQLYLPVEKKPGFHRIELRRCGEMRFLAARRSGPDAEKAASRAVMDFLAARHPRLAQSARQFYVSAMPDTGPGLRLVGAKTYTCGIALQAPLELSPGCTEVENISWPAGEYAVLEGSCCGNTGAYEAVLDAWVRGCGLHVGAGSFALYETDGSYDKQDIRVKIYRETEK